MRVNSVDGDIDAYRDYLRLKAERDEMDKAYDSLSHCVGALRVERDELLAALKLFVEDERFQVAIGGNPGYCWTCEARCFIQWGRCSGCDSADVAARPRPPAGDEP